MQRQPPGGFRASVVLVVADDRTIRVSQMHAKLITPTRFWRQLDQRALCSSLDHSVTGYRTAGPLAGRGTVEP